MEVITKRNIAVTAYGSLRSQGQREIFSRFKPKSEKP